jgi:hypothetical protein
MLKRHLEKKDRIIFKDDSRKRYKTLFVFSKNSIFKNLTKQESKKKLNQIIHKF